MQTTEIEPRIVIIEDNEKIQGFLRRRLDVVKKASGHCIIPDNTAVSTLAGFEQIMREISDISAPFSSMIVDINLGDGHEDDGMKVLELIQERFKGKLHPLVYSAYPNRRKECIELGVEEDGFFVKNDGRLLDDIEKLKQKIELSYLEAYRDKILPTDITLLIANNRIKRAYRYVGAFFETIDFTGINQNLNYWILCSFLSNPIKTGLNTLALQENVFKFNFVDLEEPVIEKKPFFIQEINEFTGRVEGYRLCLKEKTHYVNLPDFTIVEEAFETIINFVKKEDTLANRFAEFFLATRMVNLYLEGSENEKTILVDLSKKFHYPSHEQIFVFGIWEGVAQEIEKEEALHQYFFHQYSKYQFQEIFYGEVMELSETMASVKIKSPTAPGEEFVGFYRDIAIETLKKFDIAEVGQQFKTITYEEESPKRMITVFFAIPPNLRLSL